MAEDRLAKTGDRFLDNGERGWELKLEAERDRASNLSNQIAGFVLKHGSRKPDSVWFKWEVVDSKGGSLKLQVADVNEHGRDLKAILKGGNQNDRLETHLKLPKGEGFVAGSTWSLPKKELTWLRAYPSLASLINWKHEEWYTFFPSSLPDQPKDEIIRAYLLYNEYLGGVKAIVDNHQKAGLIISEHLPMLSSSNKAH